jgi:hypothetical protein
MIDSPYNPSGTNSMYGFIEESYNIIYETFIEFLNNKDELFNKPSNDLFGGLLEKINYARNKIKEDTVLFEEIRVLENKLYEEMVNIIIKDYPGDDRFIEDPIELRNLIALLYYNFYYDKRNFMLDSLVNYVYKKRNYFLEKYPINNNDIQISKMKSDFIFKNNLYYKIIVSYENILTEIISSDFNIDELIINSDLDLDEHTYLLEYFELSDRTSIMKTFVNECYNRYDYFDLATDFKERLIENFKNTI